MDHLRHLFDAVPPAAVYAVTPFVTVALVLSFVTVYTRWQYYQSLRQFVHGPIPGKQQLVESPQIPYTIPILGNTLSFLAPRPGQYWDQLFTGHPRSTGICTLLLGGRKTHILFGDVNSPSAVQALFKAKSPSRDVFDRDVFQKVFQLPDDQIHNLEAGRHHEVEMNSKYLTNFERVNELTAELTKVLDEVLAKDSQEIEQFHEIGLYQWLRDRLFTTSTRALFGDELLKMYPAYCEDFFAFDSDLLSFFFSLPSFMMGDAFRRRRRIIDELERWSKKMHELSGTHTPSLSSHARKTASCAQHSQSHTNNSVNRDCVPKADLTERQVAHLLIPKAQPGSPSSAAVSQPPPLEINMSDILLRTAKFIPRCHPARISTSTLSISFHAAAHAGARISPLAA
ncbi:hypothetical protein LTR03_013085 [Friedmanniomyces endolithicus]|nr:hypothetical protein LTR03_013085 [Friedmanniomyces endolithicus]